MPEQICVPISELAERFFLPPSETAPSWAGPSVPPSEASTLQGAGSLVVFVVLGTLSSEGCWTVGFVLCGPGIQACAREGRTHSSQPDTIPYRQGLAPN